MLLLVSFLAVVIFAESQAILLRDEPRSKLTELTQELLEYMKNISNAMNEKQILMRRSEFGQQLELYFEDNVSQLKRRWNKLQSKLPSEMAEAYNIAVTVPIAVLMKTFASLMEARGQLKPAIEKFYDFLHPILAPHATPILNTARAHARNLTARVQEADANLNQNLISNLDKLTAWLVPYAQTFRGQWGDFLKSLEPFTNQVQEQIKQGVEANKRSWRPYVAPVQEIFRQSAKVFYELLLKD